MKNILDCLSERGLIESLSSEELRSHLSTPKRLYLGFDPTADSLHIGHLLGIIVLRWFQEYGHEPCVIVGGATGRIGDPSGKSVERPVLEESDLLHNVKQITHQIQNILSKTGKKALYLDNYAWWQAMPLLNFLRDVGKHFRMGVMLGKEMVRNRLHSEEGISYTEFSYQLFQSYDFFHLFKEHHVTLQIGGSDQWGNITSGIEFVRKVEKKEVFGLTFPLLTRSDGKKFGKSEGGAVWLAPEKFSPYDLYQYLYRMPDADVIRMLKMLTFLSVQEIHDIETRMNREGSEPNLAQKILAKEVTQLVHGEEGLLQAMKVTDSLKPGATTELSKEVLQELEREAGSVPLLLSEVVGEKWVEIAKKAGLVPSKGEALRLIQNGGAYLNNVRVEDPLLQIKIENIIDDSYLLIGSGKKKKILISLKK